MDERVILCFGDSNTWGYQPGTDGGRFPRETRWPGVLQQRLGDEYRVIDEGLNARTTALDHPWRAGRNGRKYLFPCLQTHAPLDLVIIFLGTNDLADRYSLPANEIAEAAASLVPIVRFAECGRDGGMPPVLLVCPPPIAPDGPFGESFTQAPAKSEHLGEHYAEAAALVGAEALDLKGVVSYCAEDPIHLDADGHRALAETVEPIVRRLAP